MRFKSTPQIFGELGEVFDPNWLDSDKIILPPSPMWDYKRPMQIEDVDVWEVIWEASNGWGVYASWCPYAEFYLILNNGELEFYYGPEADKTVQKRIKELNIPHKPHKKWINDEHLWIYKKQTSKQIIF